MAPWPPRGAAPRRQVGPVRRALRSVPAITAGGRASAAPPGDGGERGVPPALSPPPPACGRTKRGRGVAAQRAGGRVTVPLRPEGLQCEFKPLLYGERKRLIWVSRG